MFWLILPLVLMTFAIGTEKYVIVGIISNIANDLNISLPDANLLITYYVFGIAITGPLWIIVLRKVNKLYSLLFLTLTFTIGNAMAWYSSSYSTLLAGRIIASFTHAPFIGIASIFLSERFNTKASKLIATLFGGLTVANIVGVPMGTIIGQNYGWRTTFGMITMFGLISLPALYFLLKDLIQPNKDIDNSTQNTPKGAKLKDEFLIFFRKREVLATLLMSISSFASLFILITYMSVVLMKIAGFTKQELGYILSLLGIGMTLGSFVGGKFYKSRCEKLFYFFKNNKESHWNSNHFLILMLFAMIGVEYLFSFLSYIKIFAVFGMFFFGFVTFIMVPFTQTRIIEKAKDAPNLASTFNVASFNIGSGLGSLIAGTALGYGVGVEKMSLIAIVPTSIVVLLAYYNVILDRKNQKNKNNNVENVDKKEDDLFQSEEELISESN
jgi:DHA1 family inner membrane transport protein